MDKKLKRIVIREYRLRKAFDSIEKSIEDSICQK